MSEIGCGLESLRIDDFFQPSRRNIADVRGALIDLFCLRLVNFKSSAFEAFRRKFDEQRQAHVAEANHAHVRLFIGY